jgi:hypothetical protein
MQEMMKNMMGDWMKNFEGLKGIDFPMPTGQMDFMKDMNVSKIGRQALDFQKLAFNNTYDMILKIQKQTEKAVQDLMAGQTMIPAEGQKMIDGWRDMAKKGQDEFKKAIDKGFNQSEAFLANLEQFGAPKEKAAKSQKSGK